MALHYRILGAPDRDNAALITVNAGQKLYRFMFDCGSGCTDELGISDIAAVDHLLFSHFHMDHIAGFDNYFRVRYSNDRSPNMIWGPPGAIEVMSHRFQGFTWNLHHDQHASWTVCDIHENTVVPCTFRLSEAFSRQHMQPESGKEGGVIIDTPDCLVKAIEMDHKAPCMAYCVREKEKINVEPGKLKELDLKPGPWLKVVKDSPTSEEVLALGDTEYTIKDLADKLVVCTPGKSIAYLTDFLMDERARSRLAEFLYGCDTIICEAQYRHVDIELSRRNYHMTTKLAAELAAHCNAGELVFFHLSDRYEANEYLAMLEEAREIFPNTAFPREWGIGG
jgi:ribonuclease Z